jgi:hypothetical protein
MAWAEIASLPECCVYVMEYCFFIQVFRMTSSKIVLLKYKEQSMIQRELEPSCRQHTVTSGQAHLLERHPVLIPVILLSGSVGLCAASFFADVLFPLLTWVGAPSALLCLTVALVLGISGVLASIISILESIDRYRLRNQLRAATFPKPKGA